MEEENNKQLACLDALKTHTENEFKSSTSQTNLHWTVPHLQILPSMQCEEKDRPMTKSPSKIISGAADTDQK